MDAVLVQTALAQMLRQLFSLLLPAAALPRQPIRVWRKRRARPARQFIGTHRRKAEASGAPSFWWGGRHSTCRSSVASDSSVCPSWSLALLQQERPPLRTRQEDYHWRTKSRWTLSTFWLANNRHVQTLWPLWKTYLGYRLNEKPRHFTAFTCSQDEPQLNSFCWIFFKRWRC